MYHFCSSNPINLNCWVWLLDYTDYDKFCDLYLDCFHTQSTEDNTFGCTLFTNSKSKVKTLKVHVEIYIISIGLIKLYN